MNDETPIRNVATARLRGLDTVSRNWTAVMVLPRSDEGIC